MNEHAESLNDRLVRAAEDGITTGAAFASKRTPGDSSYRVDGYAGDMAPHAVVAVLRELANEMAAFGMRVWSSDDLTTLADEIEGF